MVCKKSVSALFEPATPTQLAIISKDINEHNNDKLKHNERLIHEWILCQKQFPKEIDKGFVRGILRGHKHILEKTKKKLENHFAARHMYPEIFANRSPFTKDIVQAMDVVNIASMPKLTPKGQIIHMFGLHRFDPSEFNFQHAVKLFLMMYELLISSDSYFTGDIAIFDAAHFSAGHLAKWFGPFLKTMTILLREAYVIRLKEIHIINAPFVISKMVAVIKPILHAKVQNSIYIHDNPRSIVDLFGPEYFPSNYGGHLKSIREITTDWYEAINDNAQWFKSQEQCKITRIPKTALSTLHFKEEFGIEGSFRKLNID